MIKNIHFNLKEVHGNIVKMIIDGETAGYIVTPANIHGNQALFTISHKGEDLGYQCCASHAFESIARKYERVPASSEIELVISQDKKVINIIILN